LVYHRRAANISSAAFSTVSGGTAMNLPHNVGKTDKYLRIGAGIALIGLAATGIIGAWGFIGILPLGTGMLNTCPAYTLTGIDTSTSEKKS
jgi:hypothetical protein